MAAPNLPCPERIKPQLLTMASRPPASGDWLYEIKFDGYRMMVRIDQGRVTLFTKNGYDWTKRMPILAKELLALPVRTAWLDAEVVMQDADGRPRFAALQSAFNTGRTSALCLFAFDLLFENGRDLRCLPIEKRRARLTRLLGRVELEHIRLSDAFDVDPGDLLHNICAIEMEGLVCKRKGSAYTSERDGNWIKVKCSPRQEFIVIGYTKAAGGIGSLLLGLYDAAGRLTYAGRVRSGFDSRTLQRLSEELAPLKRSDSPLNVAPKLAKGIVVRWVEPECVVEVKYTEILPSGKVRHAVFLGIREDKMASEVNLETDSSDEP
ncbi:non-homologous end-joining DNA ligase [Pseudomonas abietaniphila]|uniref:DNA ligase (ATP) n=1 Tax=Pseudomonas abietaniphila TaxID=89065 RepID=A0A1G8RRZ7_9PSED|nr:non-homologous end-joining DNA ligase [Pseudomonas abietaniphila]SDJ19140.1 bifunctional non-homologous end joining protein LigD [Pseudomonas abietaniphila]